MLDAPFMFRIATPESEMHTKSKHPELTHDPTTHELEKDRSWSICQDTDHYVSPKAINHVTFKKNPVLVKKLKNDNKDKVLMNREINMFIGSNRVTFSAKGRN